MQHNDLRIHGPYTEYSSPFGKTLQGLNRSVWYVSKMLQRHEQHTEWQRLMGERSLGKIVRFDKNKKRYIIEQLYPVIAFTTLNKAIDYLVKNDGKLVFCS